MGSRLEDFRKKSPAPRENLPPQPDFEEYKSIETTGNKIW